MNYSEKFYTLKDVTTIVATIVAWLPFWNHHVHIRSSQADVSCNGYANCLTSNRLSLMRVNSVSMLVAKPTCHPDIANCLVYGSGPQAGVKIQPVNHHSQGSGIWYISNLVIMWASSLSHNFNLSAKTLSTGYVDGTDHSNLVCTGLIL